MLGWSTLSENYSTLGRCQMSNFIWKLLQLVIIAAVVCWLIYDKAPGSGLAHGVVAVGAAWLLTVFPFWIIGIIRRYWRRRQTRVLRRNHAPEQDVDLLGPQR